MGVLFFSCVAHQFAGVCQDTNCAAHLTAIAYHLLSVTVVDSLFLISYKVDYIEIEPLMCLWGFPAYHGVPTIHLLVCSCLVHSNTLQWATSCFTWDVDVGDGDVFEWYVDHSWLVNEVYCFSRPLFEPLLPPTLQGCLYSMACHLPPHIAVWFDFHSAARDVHHIRNMVDMYGRYGYGFIPWHAWSCKIWYGTRYGQYPLLPYGTSHYSCIWQSN